MIGLRLVGESPSLFARVLVGNGGLSTGDHKMPDAFLHWQKFARETEVRVACLPLASM
jgi:hypothetical protein